MGRGLEALGACHHRPLDQDHRCVDGQLDPGWHQCLLLWTARWAFVRSRFLPPLVGQGNYGQVARLGDREAFRSGPVLLGRSHRLPFGCGGLLYASPERLLGSVPPQLRAASVHHGGGIPRVPDPHLKCLKDAERQVPDLCAPTMAKTWPALLCRCRGHSLESCHAVALAHSSFPLPSDSPTSSEVGDLTSCALSPSPPLSQVLDGSGAPAARLFTRETQFFRCL